MDNIQFSEEQSLPNQKSYSPVKKSVFAAKLVSWGIAKDEKVANAMLLVFGLVCLFVSFYIFANTLGLFDPKPSQVTPSDLRENPILNENQDDFLTQ